MFLRYETLSSIFPEATGIKESTLDFHTVSCSATQKQPKGLFIPIEASAGELQVAISNGAIGAVWEKGKDVPGYTPNHFPIFFTENLLSGLKGILIEYKEMLNKEEIEKKDKTNFLFLDEKLLNDFYKTYDNAVMEAKIDEMLEKIREEKE
jgi:hypothetical protein